MASAAAATLLGALTVAAARDDRESALVPVLAGWWVVAALVGLWVGRGTRAAPSIAGLLAQARSATTLPDQRAGRVLLNRLWPLLLLCVGPGAVSFLVPQVPGLAAGFAIVGALGWRHQDKAVAAIEERDGVAFYVERTSPLRPIRLVRTPGFRRGLSPAG